MKNTVESYLTDLRGKRVADIGIGVSNPPLVRMLRRGRSGHRVRKNRARTSAPWPTTRGLGNPELDRLSQGPRSDRTWSSEPVMHPETPQHVEAASRGLKSPRKWRSFSGSVPCPIIGDTARTEGPPFTTSRLLEAAGIPCNSSATSANRFFRTSRPCWRRIWPW